MNHISTTLIIVGLLFDLSGAVIVLASDWRKLRQWLIQLGGKFDKLATVPVIGSLVYKLNMFSGLERVQGRYLSGRKYSLNWTKNQKAIPEDSVGFDALKSLVVDEFGTPPQFNRFCFSVIPRGHTEQADVSNAYLITNIITVLEKRRRQEIEPWLLSDNIDSIPLEKVENAIEQRKNKIIVGIGAKLLIVGFSIQIIATLL